MLKRQSKSARMHPHEHVIRTSLDKTFELAIVSTSLFGGQSLSDASNSCLNFGYHRTAAQIFYEAAESDVHEVSHGLSRVRNPVATAMFCTSSSSQSLQTGVMCLLVDLWEALST